MTKTKLKLVSFTVGDKIYGIDLSLVQEFIENIECTQLPCTHNFIVGVINLRGRIITVSDMGLIFEDAPCKEKKLLMVMRSSFNYHAQGSKTPVAFIVDQNGPIVVLKEDELVNIPDFSKSDILHLCSHAVKTEKGMLSIIDPEKLYKVLLNDCE
jgi:purine-binding chemotaxis protein CheW